jgi:predicted DNA-binding transcriptional regulator AlpA
MAGTLDLVGSAEIATMLGLSQTRVNQLATGDATFPRPVVELTAGRIWKRSDIEKWARASGRLAPKHK